MYARASKNIFLNLFLEKLISSNNKLPFFSDPDVSFIMLFSFQNFSYFHKCLGYILQNKTIDEEYFKNFVEMVQK